MTRILHTSDWHLGKKLYKKERWPEQVKFLDWLIDTIIEEEVEILIIAGDIFDTPMPPTYALKGLFDFYKRLEEIKDLKLVLVIGGNHDSGKLVEAPIPLLGDKFKILGRPEAPPSEQQELESWLERHKVSYKKECGTVERAIELALFPFFRASDILVPQLNSDSELAPDQLLLASFSQWLQHWDLKTENYNIFIGHHLFGSFFESGSEQGVGLSGLATLPLNLFTQWDILCLGHIHKPQCLKKGAPLAYYSGSPIPMRFSEKEQKSVVLYNLDDHSIEKSIAVETLAIPQFRPLIQLESNEKDWISHLKEKWDDLIEKYQTIELSPFLELTLKFDRPNPSYIDTIREELKVWDIELLNYYQIVENHSQETKEQTLDAKMIQSARMDELFDLYLEDQQLEQEQREEVKQTYIQLMDEITQGEDHP